MQQWIDTQMIIQAMLEINANNGVPPDYWELSDGGNNMSIGKFNKNESINFLKSLNEARVYELDGRVQRAFILTPNKPREIEIPFSKVFLNSLIEYNNILVNGILLEKDNRYDDGDVLIHFIIKTYQNKPKDISVYNYHKKYGSRKPQDCTTWAIWLNKKSPIIEKQLNKKCGGNMAKLLRRAVMNFNDFLEHPEVIIKERTRNNNEKRIKRGKPALPNSSLIKVTGELKFYLNSLKNEDLDDNMGKCFEVAGYWKTYRHERYTKKSGKRQFIHPYIKGAGTPDRRVRKIDNSKQYKKNLLRARDSRSEK